MVTPAEAGHGGARPDFDVVVVGAGPVGSALTVSLAMARIRTLVLESRAKGERPHPGTNSTNARSMEHLRHWGADGHFRRANPIDPRSGSTSLFVTRGNGHLIAAFERPGSRSRLPFSSAAGAMGPQVAIERGLQARLAELPAAEIRHSSTFERHAEAGGHLVVTYRDGEGIERTCTCRYLVGADGSRSGVRRQLGIRMQGRHRIMRKSVWHIRSSAIRELLLHQFGKAAFTWFINEDRTGAILTAQDAEGEFQYTDGPLPDDFDPDDWSQVQARLYRDLGVEVPVEPLFGGEVWLHSLVAPTFGSGRVFLAGESAHLMSTYGGFGMNSGIGDAANLGWKLAAAVRRWAGPELLLSYSAERVPVVSWIRDLTEESSTHVGPGFTVLGMEQPGSVGEAIRKEVAQNVLKTKTPEMASFGAQFGAAYRCSPVIVPDGTQPPAASFGEFTPSASPGMRAPHLWLEDDRSLFDEVATDGYTLLRVDEQLDTRPLERAAAERGVPLRVLAISHQELQRLYGTGLVLLRPDHHVAWRADCVPSDPGAVIDVVRGWGKQLATRTIDLDGNRWAYVDRGDGPLLLFFHGRLSGKRAWGPQIDALCDRYRCVSFDWPGHGESGHPADGWSMDDLVSAVPRLMDALGERVGTLIGLSQGGAVAMRVAVKSPERVRALVTIGAGGDRPGPEAQEALARLGVVLRDGTDVQRRDAVVAHQRRTHAPGWVDEHPVEAELERALMLSHDRAAMALATKLQPDREPMDLGRRFGDIRCPTLVIWGRHDVRAYWGPKMAVAIPRATLVTLDDAGHQVTADAPEATTAALTPFLDEIHFGGRDTVRQTE